MRELEINRGGRVLRVRDTGAPSGAAVMYFHGTPGSRLDLCFGEQLAAECGVRLISFDEMLTALAEPDTADPAFQADASRS